MQQKIQKLKKDKVLTKYIFKELTKLLQRIDPDIKKKVVIQILKGTMVSKGGKKTMITSAQCKLDTDPPEIYIYLGSLELIFKGFIMDNLTEMIKHEIVHSFGVRDEENVSRLLRMKFFKE